MTLLRILALLVVAGATACSGSTPARPHVVLITLDTTRVDRALGTERAVELAPRLHDLARRSTRFPRARSVGSLTLPAHASMLTGLYPPRHGARANGPQVLTGDADTLAEHAKRLGYATGGFVGSLALDRAYGVSQGFDFWSQPEPRGDRLTGEITDRAGDVVVHAALSWLDSRAPQDAAPVFLWVHLFDPHAPYAPSARFLEQAGGDAYEGEVAALDAAVGDLLDGLAARGILDDAWVAVVGDHGESLGEHGEATHGLFSYDATLRVPFLLRRPGDVGGGETNDALVSVVDVAPTLLAAMGGDPLDGLDGVDLTGPGPEADRLLYFESMEGWRRYGWSPLSGFVDERGKYLHSSRPEFYALAEDPNELSNRYTDELDVARYHDAFRELAARPRLSPPPIAPLDDDRAAELAALGYTATVHDASRFPEPGSADDGPSPAERVEEAQAVEDAIAFLVRGRDEEAARRFADILDDNPRNLPAADRLIEIRMAQGRYEDALPLLLARAALPPEAIATHRALARCYAELGRPDDADRHGRRALELAIAHHERRGESEEAARLRRILAEAPR